MLVSLYMQVTFHALISCPVALVPLLYPILEVPVLLQPPHGHWAMLSMVITLIFRMTCPVSFKLGYVWGTANPSRGCSPPCTVVLLLTDVF